MRTKQWVHALNVLIKVNLYKNSIKVCHFPTLYPTSPPLDKKTEVKNYL